MDEQNRKLLIGGVVIAVIIACLAPFLASSFPDGLESTAIKIAPNPEPEAATETPLPDYAIPGMEDNPVGGVVALIIGVILVILVIFGVTAIFRKDEDTGQEPGKSSKE